MILGVRELRITFRLPTCPGGPYHFVRGNPDNPCDVLHFWSFHPGGANAVFADGAVHFLKAGMSVRTLAALITRAGGEVVPGNDF